MNTTTNQRLDSLDALRGFDMFWIIGGGMFFRALAKAIPSPILQKISEQMHHVSWEGFHFMDLIFPLFMFISGVAIPFAITKKLENNTPKHLLYLKATKRAFILMLLGFIYNGILRFDFENFRFASVLAQIGFAYLIATIITINASTFTKQITALLTILIGYAIVQLAIPVADHGAGVLTPTGSINALIDQHFLPGSLYGKTFDPEGILCIISAAAITMMGSITGGFIRNSKIANQQKSIRIAIAGIVLTVIAIIIHPIYPAIKSIWTSTFNMLTGGISLILFAIFYQIIDVWHYKKWAFFFKVIGMNSITIYLGVQIINFSHTSGYLLGGVASLAGEYSSIITILGVIALEWLLLYFMYRRKIFLKV